MIQAVNVSKAYGDIQVLKGISLKIDKGEVVSIVGASGAGKSTLLHMIGLLDRPDGGEVIIDDNNLANMTDKDLSSFRNKHIGFVFQFHHLLPEFTALENVCIPGWIGKRNDNEVKEQAKELLDYLGLKERFDHKPSQLSGGEQQRVAVARALINHPKVVLADEPSGNLDSDNARELHELFFRLRKEFYQTFVIVTHNEELAKLADREVTIRDGRLF
ncbi:lipoprotein-releasing system ATP-binding protein LolD [Bacteroidota bacterium]|nr:lipoprotein-releasing system ATP-binding protein LolD [Bacteroidota bacterium]